MKIIDNPALGIGLLVCVGVAVLGLSLIKTVEGQSQARTPISVTSDDDAFGVSTMTSADDFDDSPFLDQKPPVADAPRAISDVRARTGAQWSESQQTAQVPAPAQATSELPERTWIENAPERASDNMWIDSRIDNDPFASTPERQPAATPENDARRQVFTIERTEAQPRDAQRQSSVIRAVEARREPATPSIAEKRDELLFRIVELRLQRGEFEQLAQVVMQMQNPEKAIEAMLDFADESEDNNISELLDVATEVTLQMGQPRPPVPLGALTSGVMPGLAASLGATPPSGMGGSVMPPGPPTPGPMAFGGGGFTPGPGQAMPPGAMPMGAMPPGGMGGPAMPPQTNSAPSNGFSNSGLPQPFAPGNTRQ